MLTEQIHPSTSVVRPPQTKRARVPQNPSRLPLLSLSLSLLTSVRFTSWNQFELALQFPLIIYPGGAMCKRLAFFPWQEPSVKLLGQLAPKTAPPDTVYHPCIVSLQPGCPSAHTLLGSRRPTISPGFCQSRPSLTIPTQSPCGNTSCKKRLKCVGLILGLGYCGPSPGGW